MPIQGPERYRPSFIGFDTYGQFSFLPSGNPNRGSPGPQIAANIRKLGKD
jgi:hypothetical protein